MGVLGQCSVREIHHSSTTWSMSGHGVMKKSGMRSYELLFQSLLHFYVLIPFFFMRM